MPTVELDEPGGLKVAKGPEPDDLVATDLVEDRPHRVAAGADRGEYPPLVAPDLDVLTGRLGSQGDHRLQRHVPADLPPLVDLGPDLVQHGQHRNGGLAARRDDPDGEVEPPLATQASSKTAWPMVVAVPTWALDSSPSASQTLPSMASLTTWSSPVCLVVASIERMSDRENDGQGPHQGCRRCLLG